jgi:hypothetical protein
MSERGSLKLEAGQSKLVDLCFGPASSSFDGTDKAYAEPTMGSANQLARMLAAPGPDGQGRLEGPQVVVDMGSGSGLFLVSLAYALRGTIHQFRAIFNTPPLCLDEYGLNVAQLHGFECVQERVDVSGVVAKALKAADGGAMTLNVTLADITNLTTLPAGTTVVYTYGYTFVDDELSNIEFLCRQSPTVERVVCTHKNRFYYEGPGSPWQLVGQQALATRKDGPAHTFCVFKRVRRPTVTDSGGLDGASAACAVAAPDSDSDNLDGQAMDWSQSAGQPAIAAAAAAAAPRDPVLEAVLRPRAKRPQQRRGRVDWSSERNAGFLMDTLSKWRQVEVDGLKEGLTIQELRSKITPFLTATNKLSDPSLPFIPRQTFLDRVKRHRDDEVVRLGRQPLLQVHVVESSSSMLCL